MAGLYLNLHCFKPVMEISNSGYFLGGFLIEQKINSMPFAF